MPDADLPDRWLELDGPVNVRDLGGLPTTDGGRIRPHRMLRSDHLQVLSARDREVLLEEVGVTDVLDLRTDAERESEGPAPLDAEPGVTVHRLSLMPQAIDRLREIDGDLLLPWQTAPGETPPPRSDARSVYVHYLRNRPDSVLAALRAVAYADGAAVVHCAAGKDRTGTVVALALDLAGVHRDLIRADYLLTGERIEQIVGRLLDSPTYRANLVSRTLDSNLPREQAILDVLAEVDDAGGTESWLAGHGWTPTDTSALRTRLVAD